MFKEILDINIPVVMMFHFNPEEVLSNSYLYNTFNKMDCVQVLMESDIQKVLKLIHPKKIVWIPNCVPQFNDVVDYNKKTIINVGRVERIHKRQRYIIEAFNKVKDKFPDWCVEMWGDTDFDNKYYLELCELIRKYELKDKVKFCGKTNEIEDKLRNASIFAFPSKSEGFALALTEAMSMGLPSIGFRNCSSVNELIVDRSNGILCDEDVQCFAEALEELMSSLDKRVAYGKQAKKDMEQYAPNIIWDRWEELLSELT